MNFETLRDDWSAHNERLEKLLHLNESLVKNIQTSAARSQLKWVLARIVAELVLAGIAVIWLGSFNYAHLSQPLFLAPGLMLHMGAIAYIGSRVHQWLLIGEIDYSGPVVQAQRRLHALRVVRIKSEKWEFASAFLLWFPFLLVALKGLLGVDLWAVAGSVDNENPAFMGWIIANIVFGAVVFAAVPLLARWLAARYAGTAWLSRFLDDLAGKRLTQAQAELTRIQEFEEGAS